MTLDVFQIQQCDNQGKLFESLDRRDIDAKAFIKAFMNSRAAAGLAQSAALQHRGTLLGRIHHTLLALPHGRDDEGNLRSMR